MFAKKDAVKSLQDKSASIVSVFTKTVNELTAVNNKIQEEQQVRADIIAKAQAENNDLTAQLNENTNLITKISNLFK